MGGRKGIRHPYHGTVIEKPLQYFPVCKAPENPLQRLFLLAGSPSPSAHCVRIHLSQRERPWHDGKVSVQSAKCVVSPEALPLRKDSPRSGGRCRAATKGGIWHRVAMTERASPPTKIHSRDVLLHAKRTVARYFVQRFFFRWISLSSRCRQGWRPARWKRHCTASLRSALPAPAWAG